MDWGKVPKYVGPGCSPSPPPVKKSLLVMLVDASANSYIEFADVKILLLFCQLFCSSANNINKSMIFHNIHVNLSASSLLVLCLFITYPCFFLFSIKLWESLSDLLIMNRTSPVLSLYFHSGLSLGKMSKQFLYKYRNQRV